MHKRRTVALLTAALAAASLLLAGCIVPSPSPGTNAYLTSVAAVSSTNAYAAGSFYDKTGQHDFMEHWNGTSWQEVFLPGPFGTGLIAITAVNASNLWAVSDKRTLHFDGTSWRSLPNPPAVVMQNVASAADGAVYGYGRPDNGGFKMFLMTAGGWRLVSTFPATGPACAVGSNITDLAVVKAKDVWATGNGNTCTAVLHWDGTRWQQSPPLATNGGIPQLQAVSAPADTSVWVVGARRTTDAGSGREAHHSVVLHWNGAHWTSVPTTDTAGAGFLTDVDATTEGVWAVGTSPVGGLMAGMLIKKLMGSQMVDQPVQPLPIAGSPTEHTGFLSGVSVNDGVVTSVGMYVPRDATNATLIDRRNAN